MKREANHSHTTYGGKCGSCHFKGNKEVKRGISSSHLDCSGCLLLSSVSGSFAMHQVLS
jgi:hypothetical protein